MKTNNLLYAAEMTCHLVAADLQAEAERLPEGEGRKVMAAMAEYLIEDSFDIALRLLFTLQTRTIN